MSFVRFEHLLERTMGLSVSSIGAPAIERAVRARLRACNLERPDDYWDRIRHHPDELQELIETVVVPETWFFRDLQAFTAMTRVVMDRLSANPSSTLRLLSLPCSTGEEPYTMAMALIDAGLPVNRFRIDAIDISCHALAKAEHGLYGGNSFRGQDIAFRERHFEPIEQGYRLGDSSRAPVRFMQGNLFDADFLRRDGVYDIVFCRNLLIYFDSDAQSRAIGVLKRLLSPAGMLFVGHSEAGLMQSHGLSSAKIPMAFAFHKDAATQDVQKAKPAPLPSPFAPKAAAARKAHRQLRPATKFRREAPPTGLDELRGIADRGRLAEAARGCATLIRERGPSSDAFLLLGLVSDAGGDLAAAAGWYRKALYLEPDHPEALSHLALLLKKQGDVSGLKVVNDRIRRLDARRAG